MRLYPSANGDAHDNGDCWPDACPVCQAEADLLDEDES